MDITHDLSGEVFGGWGDSGSSYLVEVSKEEDAVSDISLGHEHCLLFFDGGDQSVGGERG